MRSAPIEQDRRFRERYLIIKDDLQLRSETDARVLFRTKLLHKIRARLKDSRITPPTIQDADFTQSPDEAFKAFMRSVHALAALQSGNRYVSIAEMRREFGPMPENLSERMARLAEDVPLVVERRLTTYQYRLTIGLFARHLRHLQDERPEQ